MESRSKLLAHRILKDIVKDIKNGAKEDPEELIRKIDSLLDLAKVVLANYKVGETIDLTHPKPKRKYNKKVKVEHVDEAELPKEKDPTDCVLA